jgi:hypothetical protein
MVKVIVAKEKYDCSHLLGQFVDESNYDILVEEDTDCYLPADCDPFDKQDCVNNDCANCTNKVTKDERKIAFKFRKNFFTKEEQEQAYIGLREAATQSQNRGLAAGPKGEKCVNREWVTDFQFEVLEFLSSIENSIYELDLKSEVDRYRELTKNDAATRGYVWLTSETKADSFVFEEWLEAACKKNADIKIVSKQAKSIIDKYISDTTYANPVFSGIAGWFDRYPRIPYARATAYTQQNFDKFKLSFPFLQSLNRGFKELLPWRWNNQNEAIKKIDPAFVVPGTVFTTITVNKTFRTAAHYDAGDFSDGLSNLLVLSNNGNYSGGYLVFPEIRVAVNVRPGDLLLVNNHEVLHGNTPIVLNDEDAERISLVCYLREGLIGVNTKREEDHRFFFVEERRKNNEHPLWHKRWNGVSPGMWESPEWKEYLIRNNQMDLVEKYFPTETINLFDL